MIPAQPAPATLPRHLPALDGLRGIAVALVIASHAFPMLPELPWIAKRFSNLGFFGVQLFFVVSSVTLANSWRRSEATGGASLRGFAVRRVFRIAPAYFLAALGYWWLLPPATVDATRLLTFATFTNGWTPAQMPTVPGAWVGVPGGWSIEAEFAFYALFPAIILLLRGLARAVLGLLLSLPLAWLANTLAWTAFEPTYGPVATDQFLYYWLPNQLPVFLCGLVAYEVVVACLPGGRLAGPGRRLAAAAPAIVTGCAVAFLALAVIPWPRLPQPGHAFVPSHVLAALAFSTATAVLSLRPVGLVLHPKLVLLGQASFSAYLVHFAVIRLLEQVVPGRVFAQVGVAAIAWSCGMFLAVLLITALVTQLTYRCIELPGMRLGARLIGPASPRPHPTGPSLAP